MGRLRGRLGALTLGHLWLALPIAFIFVVAAAIPVAQADYWFHVAVGEVISRTGAIPALDEYSSTRFGEPYPSYQQFWLADLAMYWIYRLGGPLLASTAHAVMLAATYGILLRVCWLTGRNMPAAAIATMMAALLGMSNWNIRPQTISFLFGALLLLAIAEHRRAAARGWLVLVPAVMVAWVNVHGTFPIGLAIIGLWLLDEVRLQVALVRSGQAPPATGVKCAAITLLLAVAATFVHPGGAAWLGYVGGMTVNDSVQTVSEWLPPDPTTTFGMIFFAGLLAVVLLLMGSPDRPNSVELVTFVMFAVLALRYGRGSVWFGIVMAPIAARYLGPIFNRRAVGGATRASAGEARFATVGLVTLLLVSLFAAPPVRSVLTGREVLADNTPVSAANYLLTHQLPGPIFNSQIFGSYIIWAAQPEYPVFVDSRVELYPEALWDDYRSISAAVWDWEDRLERYEIKTLFLDPEYAENLIKAAGASPRWVESFRDDDAVIFTRAN